MPGLTLPLLGAFSRPAPSRGAGQGAAGGLRTSGSLRSRGDTEGDTCSGALPPPWAAAGWGHPSFGDPPKPRGCPQPRATCSRGAGAVTSAVPTGDRGPRHHQGTVEHSAPSHPGCHLTVGPILPPATPPPPMSPHPSWRGRGRAPRAPAGLRGHGRSPAAGLAPRPLLSAHNKGILQSALPSHLAGNVMLPLPPQPARIN